MSDPDVYRRLEALERWQDAMAAVETSLYRTGTFTPTFGGSSTDGTLTYDIQIGRYVRMDVLCWFSITIRATVITVAPTGLLYVRGLPFAASSVGNHNQSVAIGDVRFIDLGATTVQIAARIQPGQQFIDFREVIDNANSGSPTGSALSANALMFLTGTYEIGT